MSNQIAQKNTANVYLINNDKGFAKSLRLLKPNQFRHVFDKPDHKYHASHIMAFVRTNELTCPRIGLAITKKKVPTAVGRNRFKRIARDNFRCMATQLEHKDIVFIAKRPINELSNNQLHQQVRQILSKLNRM